jgi:hypothetical protein
LVVVIIDGWSSLSPYAELKFANQIYTHVAVAIFILFYNVVNWPVDAVDAARKAPKANEAGVLDLNDDL